MEKRSIIPSTAHLLREASKENPLSVHLLREASKENPLQSGVVGINTRGYSFYTPSKFIPKEQDKLLNLDFY